MTTMMMVVATGGLGVLMVAWVAAISFRRASASLRHSIWLAALFAAVALPAFEAAGFDVEVPVPAEFAVAVPDLTVFAGGGSAGDGRVVARASMTESGGSRAPEAARDVAISGSRPAATMGTPAATMSAPATAMSTPATAMSTPAPDGMSFVGLLAGVGLGTIALVLWVGVALALLALTVVSHARARSIISHETEAPSAEAWTRLRAARLDMDVHRPVGLVVSRKVTVPATWGFARPVIVLPRDYERWSGETLDRVLLHELAHIARRDCETYLVGDIAKVIHWYNPLAWYAARSLRVESERACDDRVLQVISRPSAYAADLVAMVRGATAAGGVPLAALAMAQPGSVSDRVRAILDPTRSRARVRPPAAGVIGAVALGLVLSATVVTPTARAANLQDGTDGFPSRALASDDALPPAPEAMLAPDLLPSASDLLPPASDLLPPASDVVPSSALTTFADLFQERLCVFREDGRRSTSINSDDDQIRIRWETDDCSVEIDIFGEVEFAADDRSVVSLGSDALFEIEERIGRDERRIRMEGQRGGVMERRFWVDGDAVAWGPEAEGWLASILPEIFRHTTINAEARVRRMVEEGGPDRVFAEVESILSDHVTRKYLEILMDVAQLDEAGYRRVIEAATEIDSDHGSSELLLAVVARAGLQPSFQDPLLAASERLESDHQRTRILQTLLDSPLSDAQLDAVLRSARSIDSDHSLGQLLSSIASTGRMDDAARASFLETMRSIDSDHQQATVIHAFLDSGRLSDVELAQVLELTDYLESDHQRADILQRVAREYSLTGAQVSSYLRSAARMDSDHQKASTARAITQRADFSGEHVGLVLQMAAGVDSDHQRTEMLSDVIRRRPLDGDELSDLFAVASKMDSSHQLETVVSLIVAEQELEQAELVGLLGVVGRIDSGHQRTSSLLGIATRYELRGEARERYSALAAELGTRDRERAMAAIGG